MTKLEQAYEAIEILKNLGLPVSSEQLEVIANLEEEKIQVEIINTLKKALTQKTKGLLTAFKLEVFYNPDTGISIMRSNKQSRQNGNKNTSRKRTHRLRVTFPDGCVIEEARVSNTLVKCIKKIGWCEVQDLNIRVSGMNLVVNQLNPNPVYRRAQIELDNGVYVNTGSNTEIKMEQLKQISKDLKLNLKIEKVALK